MNRLDVFSPNVKEILPLPGVELEENSFRNVDIRRAKEFRKLTLIVITNMPLYSNLYAHVNKIRECQ